MNFETEPQLQPKADPGVAESGVAESNAGVSAGVAVPSVNLRWIGLTDYDEALRIQRETADEVRKSGKAVFIACEHPTVVTLGKRGQPLGDILVSMEHLRENNIKIIATDRGGQATLHNPGQLIIYPIIPLRNWGLRLRDYVECLERATAVYFAEYGVEVIHSYEPGLWVNEKKIAAFGIRIDHGVSLHGLAINISNELLPFSWIRLCGEAVEVTNLTEEMRSFLAEIPQWNFQNEASKWLGIFMSELKGTGYLFR